MDFNKYNVRQAAERSRSLQLVDLDGNPIFAEGENGEDRTKPCLVWIKGTSAPSVQDEIKADRRKAMRAKDKDDEVRTLETLHQESVKAAARLITKFENIDRDDVPVKIPSDVEWFLNLTFYSLDKDENGKPIRQSFAQQIIAHAMDDQGFLANASKS